MNQDKTPMSNSYMRWAKKKQQKEYMKQVNQRNEVYEMDRKSIIEELRNCPVHDFNNLDK